MDTQKIEKIVQNVISEIKEKGTSDYIRVGDDFFKLIKKQNRYGVNYTKLKSRKRITIVDLLGKDAIKDIKHYEDFCLIPDNVGEIEINENEYNIYAPFAHKAVKGDWKWTRTLLTHIFGSQYEQGLKYLQALYLHPNKPLPVLALVSTERATGKTTFLNYIEMLFGENSVQVEPEVIGSAFNSEYAYKNIICIDETVIDKRSGTEKIKSLSTKKSISVNMKNVAQFTLPFYGKVILASNKEDGFIKVDSEEIRFWVRKIGIPKEENHDIESNLVAEIPAFLHYLKTLPKLDWSKSRMLFTKDEIANEMLENVVEESHTNLFHTLREDFADWFSNNAGDKLEFTNKDLRDIWYPHQKEFTHAYLKKVLRDEFKIKNQNEMGRYHVLGDEGNSKSGRYYTILKQDILNETDESIDNQDVLPF